MWLEGMSDSLAPMLARLARCRCCRRQYRAVAAAARCARACPCRACHPAGAGGRLAARCAASPAPPIARAPVDPFAATFVKVFALVPGACSPRFSPWSLGRALPIGGAAPLVVLSGLAVVIAAGDSIALYHQRILGFAWAGLLIVPAIFVPLLIVLLPWTAGIDLRVAQPASAMGRFFADSFERRTGQPLAVVTGDPRLADAGRARRAEPPERVVRRRSGGARRGSPPTTSARKARSWSGSPPTPTPTPPPDIKAYFPDLVAEVPRAFDRPVQGRLPVLRVGWGVIRPGSVAAAAPAAAVSR